MRVMGMNETRMKERRFVYVQCKVPPGWGSLKFRDAGGTGSRYSSFLGARCRPCVPAHGSTTVRRRLRTLKDFKALNRAPVACATRPEEARTSCVSSARGRGSGTTKETHKEVDEHRARARARKDRHALHHPTEPNQGEQDVASM